MGVRSVFLVIISILSLVNELHGVYTVGDKDLYDRIPDALKKQVNELVQNKLDQVIDLHYNPKNDVISTPRDHYPIAKVDSHSRVKRQADDVNAEPRYSEWSKFGYCTVHCGGGTRLRTRTCIEGNCTKTTDQQECGTLPCVSKSYILNGMEKMWTVMFSNAIKVQFFTLVNEVYLAGLTTDTLTIYKHNTISDDYELQQTISTQKAVSFTIMETDWRTFLVVLEKSTSYFQGVFSRMYPYDPMFSVFDTSQMTRFPVYEPSAVTAFQIYGKPFMAIANEKDKISNAYGAPLMVSICDNQSSTITCPPGTYISVVDALYGRFNSWECPSSGFGFQSQLFFWCIVNGAKDKVIAQCDNKQSCMLQAKPSLLTDGTDPCIYSVKYLKVYYRCNTLSYETIPQFYGWDGVGLRVVPSINLKTYGAKDLVSFDIHEKAYIVVANYVNDQEQHHLDSEIFVYNLEKQRFQSFQKLRTDGAVDFEFFVIGQGISREYFLAVANHIKKYPDGSSTYEVDSLIFKWNWNVFVPFQCIKTYGAKKWTAVYGDGGEFILSLVDLHGNVTFYSYNGWRFSKSQFQPQDEIFKMADVSTSVRTHPASGGYDIQYAVVSPEGPSTNTTIYSMKFGLIYPRLGILATTAQAVQEMRIIISEEILPKAAEFNRTFNAVKDTLVFTDNTSALNDAIFDNVIVDGILKVKNVTADIVNLSPSDIAKQTLLNDQDAILQQHPAKINQSESIMLNVVTKSTDQQITGRKEFVDDVLVHRLDTLGNISVRGYTNGIKLSDFHKNAFLINKDINFTHFVRFTGNVTFDSILITDSINGMSTSKIVTTNTPQHISGKKAFKDVKFASNTAENINVGGQVNDINTTNLVLLHGDQTIFGKHKFVEEATVLKDIYVLGLVNGLNVSRVVQDTLMKNQNGIVTAYQTFSNMNIEGDLEMSEFKTINGVDVSNLTASGVFLNAAKSFNNVTFLGNITFSAPISLGGKLNNEEFDSYVFVNSDVTFYQPITFTKNVTCLQNISVDGLINGLNIPGDVMDTFSNQTILGTTTITQNVTMLKNLNVGGTIDGVNMTVLYRDAMLMGKDQLVTGRKEFSRMSSKNLTLSRCPEGGDCQWSEIFEKLASNTVKRSDQNIEVRGLKTFQEGFRIQNNVNVTGMINGHQFPDTLLRRDGNETMYGHNVFKNVSFVNNVTVKTLNSYNISDLYRRVLLKKGVRQIVTGNWTFRNVTDIDGGLYVNGTVDGVNLTRDALLINENYTLTSRKTFIGPIHVHELIVGDMTVGGMIDGVNLTALNEELLKLSSDKIVKGKKIFQNHVSFAGNWTIDGLIDGVNITDLARRAMRLNTEQVVSGKKVFTASVSIKNSDLKVSGLVDGVNLTEFSKTAVLKNSPHVLIDQNITVHNMTVDGQVTSQQLVNGVNITELIDDALTRTGHQTITGTYHIHNLTVHGDFKVNGLINNINFTKEVIQLNDPGYITGFKTFKDGFHAVNITTKQLNGIDLAQFLSQIVYIDQDATIAGKTIMHSDLHVASNFQVETINFVNWTYLANTTLFKSGNQTVRVPTHFQKLMLNQDVTVSNLFNGLNLTEFEANVVYKCQGENRPITSQHKYDVIVVDGSSQIANISIQGTVNGVDVQKLYKETVYKEGNYTISGNKTMRKLTTSYLDVGTLNGFSVPNDFVEVDAENVQITGEKIFRNDVKVLGSVFMEDNETINHHDLSKMAENLVTIDGNDTILTDVVFTDSIAITENIDVGLLNEVNVSKDNLMLKSGDQNVTGAKTITFVKTEKEVMTENHINGYDLHEIYNETILSGRDNVISGKKVVTGNIIITGNLDTNLVDTVNITTLFSNFTKISNYLNHSLDTLNSSIVGNQNRISSISDAIANIYKKIDYFIEDDEIALPYKSISLDVLVSGNGTWLVAGALSDVYGNGCTNSSVYYKNKNETFVEKTKVVTSSLTGSVLLKREGELVFLTSSNRPAGNCLQDLQGDKYYGIAYQYDSEENLFRQSLSSAVGKSRSVDTAIHTGDEVNILFTLQTSQQESRCVMTNESEIYTCNGIKAIILKSDQYSSLTAVLGSDANSLKHVGIFITTDSNITLVQSIPTYHASDVIDIQSSDGLFLVIANTYDSSPEALTVSYTVPVSVFKYDESTNSFDLYQELEIYAAYLLFQFEFGSFKYMAIATLEQNIILLRHKGISKWQTELIIPTRGYNAVKAINFYVDSDDDLYLVVLTDDEWDDLYPSKVRIAKAVMSSNADGDDIVKSLNL